MKCMNYKKCENYKPKQPPKPKSTVTVWHKDGSRGQYSFNGLPDVDRVIDEVLVDEGALAIKVECNEEFKFHNVFNPGCYIWSNSVGLIRGYGWKYGDYYVMRFPCIITNPDISTAVKKYLAKHKEEIFTIKLRRKKEEPRFPKQGEWFLDRKGNPAQAVIGFESCKYEILEVVND